MDSSKLYSAERKALLELILMLRELFVFEEKQNRQFVLMRKRAYASNETSLMTTREAASVKNETIIPPQNKVSHNVTETLDFLEKKVLLVEREMKSVYGNTSKASEKFGNVPRAKRAKTADSLSTRPRSQ